MLPQLRNKADELLDPTLIIPSYYYAPIHAYKDGNLCWESALEEDLWSKVSEAIIIHNTHLFSYLQYLPPSFILYTHLHTNAYLYHAMCASQLMIAPLYDNALDGDVQMRQEWLKITAKGNIRIICSMSCSMYWSICSM
jgi:hypothetical protein